MLKSIFVLAVCLCCMAKLQAETKGDTAFILRTPGEYPEHPEKIKHAEISLYTYSGKGPEFKTDFLRIMKDLPKWTSLNSLLISHVDDSETVASVRQMMTQMSTRKNLKSLDIRASFGLNPLPEELFNIRSLEELSIWDMAIKTIPPSIGRLVNLRELYILGDRDFTVAKEVGQLKKLTTLYFHGTDFIDINGILKKFAAAGSVRDLTFIGCSYNESPKVAVYFPQLTSLMSDGLCDELDEILKLKKLKSLSLGCSFSESEMKRIHNELQGCRVELEMEFCFPGGMTVSTPAGPILIKDIKPGMVVNTLNRETGRLDTTTVFQVDKHPVSEYKILRIQVGIHQDFAGLESYPLSILLEVTPNHPLFLADGHIVSAGDLQEGDRLIYTGKNGATYNAAVTSIVNETKETELFNLVTTKQSYIVEGLLVRDKF